MNVSSSVDQRLKSLINEPKRRRNYVRRIFFIHTTNVLYPAQFNFYERFQAFDCVCCLYHKLVKYTQTVEFRYTWFKKQYWGYLIAYFHQVRVDFNFWYSKEVT